MWDLPRASLRNEKEEEQEGRFSAITYHGHNGENIIAERHAGSLHLCPLVLEGAEGKGRVFSERGDHPVLLRNIMQLVLFLPLQPAPWERQTKQIIE